MERRTRALLGLVTFVCLEICAVQRSRLCEASTPDNNMETTAAASSPGGCRVFEGDICVNDEEWEHLNHETVIAPASSDSSVASRAKRAVVKLELLKWIDGIVPYVLAPDLSSEATNAIKAAMDQFMLDTCISFQLKQAHNYDYLYFYSGSGCFSSVGRRGGQQNISIGSTCTTKGVVMHEIFHALGRWHEHSRPDRDGYVTINTQNIKSDYVNNFRLVDESASTTNDIPYDFDSIMHYDAYAFSRNSEPTIEPLDDTVAVNRLGQRSRLSPNDLDHIKQLYCEGLTPSDQWSTWSLWGDCSSTCGGGKRTRTRTCIGGDDCTGSNSESQTCNEDPCPVVPSWGSWSLWSGCSKTCGRGMRVRMRTCKNGDTCHGNSSEYEECNTNECPSKWGDWSEWSKCSKNCDGGMRYRTRECAAGVTCTGSRKEEEPCNVNVTCGEWSECSRECGGGVQWRFEDSGEKINRSCNDEACHNETCLQGLTHIGCYRLTRVKLKVFEAMTEELSDSAMTRSEPVRKCGTASLSHGNTYFSLAEGMCFSGSNQIADYTGDGESSLCSGGRGSYIGGQFVIDVYRIDDPIAFQESSAACLSCGKDFCSQTDLQSVWRLMCSVSSADQSLPNHFLLFSLVLVSSVLIVTVSLVN